MAIEFTESAGKHGFTRDDAINALENAVAVKPHFDTSRIFGRPDPTLVIGPGLAGGLLEVMLIEHPRGRYVIFHCMTARSKFLRS